LSGPGISTGVFELRGDGTFHEWTIFNQHPAGAAKMQIMEDMYMAISTQVPRTNPMKCISPQCNSLYI